MDDETTLRSRGPKADASRVWRVRGLLGTFAGSTLALSAGVYVIGKLDSAEIRLLDSGVSRNHAELRLAEDGTITLTDLGSTNGTYVCGTRVDEARIEDGDVVGIGPDAVLLVSTHASTDDLGHLRQVMTARETEVAHLVAKGMTNNEIGETLSISPRTVERHIGNALKRLELRSRVELARYILKA